MSARAAPGRSTSRASAARLSRRLSLSDYFYEVRLLPATKGIDAATHLELVRFEMSAKVRY